MDSSTIQRYPRPDDAFNSIGSPSSPKSINNNVNGNNHSNSKKKWSNWVPFFVALVVIAEIAFLGRLDMAKNADLVNSWADSFYQFTRSSSWLATSVYSNAGDEAGLDILNAGSDVEGGCEEWLEKADSVAYSRDFQTEPILVTGAQQEWKSCSVGCKFGFDSTKRPDAAFGLPQQGSTASVLRSMESAKYYAENNLDMARRCSCRLFLLGEYDIMAPLQPKTESALAAAFISNCGARNFRLQALEGLDRAKVKIDSYGSCHRNRDGRVDKVEALKRYKFSLAFENSNEEDYVTEKFFQSLVAGSVPVVVGAPNIQDFAPSPGSLLHIKEVEDIDLVAKTMKYLAGNPGVYNESLRSGNLTLEALEFAVLSKFKSLKHVPVWKEERPEKIRGGDELKVYRIYPVGMTQRQALYTFRFNGDMEFRNHIERNPCPKFEVIFV